MLNIKTISIKNFMSIGDHAETINFNNNGLTLILGENLDTSSSDGVIGRNGAGKSLIFNSLSFGLFGQSLSNITKDNLINNINKKGMTVIVEFEKDGHQYRIERGRKPNFFKFIVDEHIISDTNTNEAQGENKDTQEDVEKVLGFSHNLFKNIIALNTKTTPFLSLNAKQQREFVEELMGVLQLSQKAEVLKELLKETKNEIKQEEFCIKTVQESNERILKSVKDLELRSNTWAINKDKKLLELEEAITELKNLDIDNEINNHKELQKYNEVIKNKNSLDSEIKRLNKSRNEIIRQVEISQAELELSLEKQCPTCKQGIHSEIHNEILEKIQNELEKNLEHQIELDNQHNDITVKLESYNKDITSIGDKPKTYYNSIEDAYNHKNSVDMFVGELKTIEEGKNPYIDQIETLRTASLQEVDFENINTLSKLKDHQEFLLKLLTNKDSFIRKKILDQNLGYLNVRIEYYLEKLGLPHRILFLNDMSVEIKYLGENLDFDQLSRGESTRLILALCWSFRDIFELLNYPVNLVLVDELLDNGLDLSGIEGSFNILREMHRERKKDVFLVTHREELISKISSILQVIKENGFTSFEVLTDFV